MHTARNSPRRASRRKKVSGLQNDLGGLNLGVIALLRLPTASAAFDTAFACWSALLLLRLSPQCSPRFFKT